MLRWVVAVALIAACGKPAAPVATGVSSTPQRSMPVGELHFNDEELQGITARLTREAAARGIQTCSGTTRVECLLALESTLGAPPFALRRVNYLTFKLASSDVSQWGKLRRKAERDLCGTRPANDRVCEMFAHWNRRRYAAMLSFLSSNYAMLWIPTMEWERKFHDLLVDSPPDAGAWAWVVLHELRPTVQQQYGRANAEMAYRFYLESSGLGTAREAHDIFSVPGVEIRETR